MGHAYASVPTVDVDNYQEQERQKFKYSIVGGIAVVLILAVVVALSVRPIFGSEDAAGGNATHNRSSRSELWLPDGFPAVIAFFKANSKNVNVNVSKPHHAIKLPSSTAGLMSMIPAGGLKYLPLAMKTYGKVMAAKKRVLGGTSNKCAKQLDELLNRLVKSKGQNIWALKCTCIFK